MAGIGPAPGDPVVVAKMSATSSLGRATAAGSGLRRLALGERPEPVERAHHRADRGGGDPGV
jgi:hypothetical protein